MNKCSNGKSFNRYKGRKFECIDLYNVFDEVALNNPTMSKIKPIDLGGSLSLPMTCGRTENIETPYSKKTIDTEEW